MIGPHWLPWLFWPVYGTGFVVFPALVMRKVRDEHGKGADPVGDLALCVVAGLLWPFIVGIGAVVWLLMWMWRLRGSTP